MLKFKRILLIVSSVILLSIIAFALYIFRPYEEADPESVAPEIQRLGEGVTITGYGYFKDGGSIVLQLSGENEQSLIVSLPAKMGEPAPYSKVLIGNLYDEEVEAYEVDNSEQTRLKLLNLLRDYDIKEHYGNTKDGCIAVMSGRWSDYWRCWSREKILKFYKEDPNFP